MNTSTSEWSPNVTSLTFTVHCSWSPELACARVPELFFVVHCPSYRRLQRQISSFTSQCPNLSLARLISPQMPSLDWYAFDALSCNKLWIPRGLSWDVEGEICDDDDDADRGTKPVTVRSFDLISAASSSP